MTTTTQHLTDDERAQLAREVAADGYRYDDLIETYCKDCDTVSHAYVSSGVVRDAVKHGWDAALEWAGEQERQQGESLLKGFDGAPPQ